MSKVETDKTTDTAIDKFKKKNPNYFKNYYKNNKDKFKKYRADARTKWYGIEIFGTTYYFNKKQQINIKSLEKNDIKKNNFVFVPAMT